MLKILIVDDEPDICELIHKLIDWEELELTSLGSSQNGIDAMEIILRQKPDIVITDIQMPGMTGLEMIEKASQQKLPRQNLSLSADTGSLNMPSRQYASAWRTTCLSLSARPT